MPELVGVDESMLHVLSEEDALMEDKEVLVPICLIDPDRGCRSNVVALRAVSRCEGVHVYPRPSRSKRDAV